MTLADDLGAYPASVWLLILLVILVVVLLVRR